MLIFLANFQKNYSEYFYENLFISFLEYKVELDG